MSTWAPCAVRCPTCGHEWEVPLLKGMHITRLPEVRREIREATFQLFECERCGTPLHVEKSTIYTDFEAGHYVGVEPVASTDWAEAKARHRSVYDRVFLLGPPVASDLATRTLHRVVFGSRALREKILAWDAGLDDQIVEVAKIELMKEHRLRFDDEELRLTAILPPGDHLFFTRYHRAPAGPPERPQVLGHFTLLRDRYERLLGNRDEMRGTYWWVFDDWFVDATHRLRHPEAA